MLAEMSCLTLGSRKAFSTLLCSNASNALFQVNGCDPSWLMALGGSLTELSERDLVVCREVSQSEGWLFNRLTGVWCWLKTFEEDLAEQLARLVGSTGGSVVGWWRWVPALEKGFDRRIPPWLRRFFLYLTHLVVFDVLCVDTSRVGLF